MQAMLDKTRQDNTALRKIGVCRDIGTIDSFQVFALDQAFHSSLHHANIWLESSCQLTDDFAE